MAEIGTKALPEAVRAEIEALRPLYPTTRALLLPALHAAQRAAGGWLPEEILAAIGDYLGLPYSDVMGVVSFYDMFHDKPVGRHRIRVCTNLSCALRGAQEIVAALHDELGVGEGEVTPDGRCSYVHFECLGSCDSAPMMMVDDRYHENLTPEKARQVVRQLK
ncbi:MAG: NADH-quinone oxidoreductase subunit NuoE [Acidobacteriota bacterium]